MNDTQNDIVQQPAVPEVPPLNQAPTQPAGSKRPSWLLVAIIVAVLLLLTGMVIFMFNKTGSPNSLPLHNQPSTSMPSSQNSGGTSTSGNCGTNPIFNSSFTTPKGSVVMGIPADFPSSVPIYPGSRINTASTITTDAGKRAEIEIYCTGDTNGDVISAYLVGHGTAWALSDPYANLTPAQKQAIDKVPGMLGSGNVRFITGKMGQDNLVIMVTVTPSVTQIAYSVTFGP